MSQLILAAILLIGPNAQVEVNGDAFFSTSALRPLVGEPVEISLIVNLDAGSVMTAWPEFPMQWADFEIENVGDLTITETGNGITKYEQIITARLWEPGDYETPETIVTYQLPGESATADLIVRPVFFTVPSVLSSDNEELSPAKPPVYLAYIPPWLIASAVFAFFSVALLGAHYGLLGYRRRRANRLESADFEALGRRTLTLLREIDHQTAEPAAVYDLVAARIREFLNAHYGVAANEMTTGELLSSLRYGMSESLLARLQQLLGQADLVKFAQYQPDYDSAQRYLEASVRWLQAMMKQADTAETGGRVT